MRPLARCPPQQLSAAPTLACKRTPSTARSMLRSTFRRVGRGMLHESKHALTVTPLQSDQRHHRARRSRYRSRAMPTLWREGRYSKTLTEDVLRQTRGRHSLGWEVLGE
jgi:hypothetical protein